MRSSECLNLKWKDIYPNPLDNEEDRKERVLIKIHSEQSKLVEVEKLVFESKKKIDAIERDYKKLGIIIDKNSDYVFKNPAKTRLDKNVPIGKPVVEKRLKKVLIESGIQQKLDESVETSLFIVQDIGIALCDYKKEFLWKS